MEVETAVRVFDDGIAKLARSNEAHLWGGAYEIAGFKMSELGNLDKAKQYFEQAMNIYLHNWGALAKYQWLREKSSMVLGVTKKSEPYKGAELVGEIIEVVADS